MPPKPSLLITGASGFVGRNAIAIGQHRFEIVATGRHARPGWLPAGVEWRQVDLLDRSSVATLPHNLPFVLHLAGESVPARFSSYAPLLDSLEMTVNLCRHLRSGRLLLASSCHVYAANARHLRENDPVDPRGLYGLSKLLCEQVVLRAGSIDAAVARPFNHLGMGMRPDLAVPSIIRRLQQAPSGSTIYMKGVDSVRDFLDVNDIVAAYFAILQRPDHAERLYNVASGKPTTIGEVVRATATILGKPIAGVQFSDQANSRDDTSIVVGNADLLRRTTGWEPTASVEVSLRQMIAQI